MLCATALLLVASGLTRKPLLHQVFSSKLHRGSNRPPRAVNKVFRGVIVLCCVVLRIVPCYYCGGKFWSLDIGACDVRCREMVTLVSTELRTELNDFFRRLFCFGVDIPV